MDTPQPHSLPESSPQVSTSLAPTVENRQPSKKETVQGCGCLLLLIIIAVFLFKSCFSGEDETPQSTPIERKLAFLEYGVSSEKESSQSIEYKELLSVLAARFEITETEAGNMTHAVVKSLESDHGIKTTTMEMLRAARQVALSNGGKMLGKGKRNFASTLALLSTQMLPSK